jgi:hypothetical protein
MGLWHKAGTGDRGQGQGQGGYAMRRPGITATSDPTATKAERGGRATTAAKSVP